MTYDANANRLARAAHTAEVLEQLTPHNPIAAICTALADVWIQGNHSEVRVVIKGGITPEVRAQIANGTRALLPNDLMKEAFDLYIREA